MLRQYSPQSKHVLVTRIDANHIHLAKQLFTSARINAGWKDDMLILTHEIPNSSLTWFRQRGIIIKKCNPLYQVGDWPAYAASKLYLFEASITQWEKVIYLDPDIIVRAPLDQLKSVEGYSTTPDLGHQPLFFQFKLNSETNWKAYYKFEAAIGRKYDLTTLSFNVGVIAFDTNIIQPDTFTQLEHILQLTKNISKYGEQTAQNIYFYKRWKRLSVVYNLLPSLYIHKYNVPYKHLQAINLHFAGTRDGDKPDHCKNIFYPEWKQVYRIANKDASVKNREPKKQWSNVKILLYETYYALKRFQVDPFKGSVYKIHVQFSIMRIYLQTKHRAFFMAIRPIGRIIKRVIHEPWYID